MAKKNKTRSLPEIAERETYNNKPIAQEIITDKFIERAEKLFSIGLYESTVASLLGLHPEVFKDWLVRGAAYGHGVEAKLFNACIKSLSGSELEFVQMIREAAQGRPAEYVKDKDGNLIFDKEGKAVVLRSEIKPNPEWAAWMLERRFRSKYGRQIEIKTSPLDNPHILPDTGQNEKDIGTDEAQSAVDELNHIMTQLKEAGVV